MSTRCSCSWLVSSRMRSLQQSATNKRPWLSNDKWRGRPTSVNVDNMRPSVSTSLTYTHSHWQHSRLHLLWLTVTRTLDVSKCRQHLTSDIHFTHLHTVTDNTHIYIYFDWQWQGHLTSVNVDNTWLVTSTSLTHTQSLTTLTSTSTLTDSDKDTWRQWM